MDLSDNKGHGKRNDCFDMVKKGDASWRRQSEKRGLRQAGVIGTAQPKQTFDRQLTPRGTWQL